MTCEKIHTPTFDIIARSIRIMIYLSISLVQNIHDQILNLETISCKDPAILAKSILEEAMPSIDADCSSVEADTVCV